MAAPIRNYGGVGFLISGLNITPEIRSLGKNLVGIEKHTFRSLVKFIISDFEGKPVSDEIFQKLRENVKQANSIDVIYSSLYQLLAGAYKLPENLLKNEVLKKDLQEIGIPDDFIGDLVGVICGTRKTAIEKHYLENCVSLPKLEDVRWRVDVTISTSSLSRVLEPTVLMETTSSTGEVTTFEVQASQFHKLRFAVASLLKEMEDLKRRNVLKAAV